MPRWVMVAGRKGRFLKRLFFSMTAGPMAMSFTGLMREEGLEIELQAGGKRSKKLLYMDEAPVLDITVPFVLAHQELYPGARFQVEVFDPKSMRNTTSYIEVLGSEALSLNGKLVAATHIRRSSGQVELDTWFDKQGRVLKEEAQGGLLLLRQGKQQALSDEQGASFPSDDIKDWQKMLTPGGMGESEEK